MFVAKYVTTAMSICMQLSWISNFFVGLLYVFQIHVRCCFCSRQIANVATTSSMHSFPVMNKRLGAYSFAPFAVVMLLTFLFAWIWMPETQGTTPTELQARLVKRMSMVKYQNVDMVTSLMEEKEQRDETTKLKM